MDRRRRKLRDYNSKGINKSRGLTTAQLRNRKEQNSVPNRPQDLRSRINGSAAKVLDARTKLQQKRSVQELNGDISLSEHRKQQRSNVQAGNRSLSLESGSIKITSKLPNRSARITGKTIEITAKVDKSTKPKAHNKDRERNLKVNNKGRLTIKSKQESLTTRIGYGMSKLHSDQNVQDDITYYEYQKYKAEQMERERLSISPSWKQAAIPVADRLDVPKTEPVRTPSQTSTKVTITNLHPSVSRQDIEELFGVVGVLKSCKIVHPGTAEVVYTIKEDAITAFARYHNRNLDGQPMHCKLSSMQAFTPVHIPPPMSSLWSGPPRSSQLFQEPVVPYIPTKKPASHQIGRAHV